MHHGSRLLTLKCTEADRTQSPVPWTLVLLVVFSQHSRCDSRCCAQTEITFVLNLLILSFLFLWLFRRTFIYNNPPDVKTTTQDKRWTCSRLRRPACTTPETEHAAKNQNKKQLNWQNEQLGTLLSWAQRVPRCRCSSVSRLQVLSCRWITVNAAQHSH